MAQNPGTGIQTEVLKTNGDAEHIGSYFEKLEDAHLDISAFIKFLLSEGYTQIVLVGHSLGTIKAVRYLFEGEYANKIINLVLLSPFDKNAFMEVKAPGKWANFIDQAKAKIDAGEGNDLVPVPEWEDFTLSYKTFYSWYKQDDLNCMWDFYRKDYDFPALRKINIPVKIIVGDKDDFLVYKALGSVKEDALAVFKKYLKKSEVVFIPGAEHVYRGYEDKLADEVANFVSK